ncbi:hypothetical protein PGB90_001441 [Kerria lacca]
MVRFYPSFLILRESTKMLLERAFLRIGSAESDTQFEALIDKLLIPIIFKIPSSYENVRKKNFLVVYIKLGFQRMNVQAQLECISVLLKCVEDFKSTEQLKNTWDDHINNSSVPPGMSNYTFKRIIQDGKIDDFLQVKLGILHLLHDSDVPIEEKYIHYVTASVDIHTDVAELGKQYMKQFHGAEIYSFKEVAPNFLNVLTEILWKREMDDVVRILIYRLAGNVISLNPELVKYHKEIFPKFIEDLTEETLPEVKSTIKESLLKMACAFKQTEQPETLMHFLANRITSPESSVRHIILHYLHKVFSSDHVQSRFLLVWSSADNDPKIREEAEHLLLEDLKTSKSAQQSEPHKNCLPGLIQMLQFLWEGCCSHDKVLQTNFVFGDQNLPISNNAYIKLLLYLRSCMLYDCHKPLCNMKFEHPCIYTPRIGIYLRNLYINDEKITKKYLELISLIVWTTSRQESLKCLLECIGTVPDIFAAQFYPKLPMFEKTFNSNSENIVLAATITGIIIVYGSKYTDLKDKLEEFKTILTAKNINQEQVEMTLWCIASVAERKGFAKISGILSCLVEAIVDLINHTSPKIALAACHCIGQIGRRNELPFPNRNLKDPLKYGDFDGLRAINETCNEKSENRFTKNTEKMLVNEHLNSLTKLKIVEKLLDQTLGKNISDKLKMKAAEALGLLCVGEKDFPYRKLIINTIVEKENERKEIGMLLDLGNVISDCILGSYSVRGIDLWVQTEVEYKLSKTWDPAKEQELFLFTFDKITNELISDKKYKSKTAAVIWLLVLMKRCIKLPLNSNILCRIQYSFLELMSLNDEIVHDAATKGLSFIPRFTNNETSAVLAKQLIDKICLVHKKVTEIGAVLEMYKEFCYLVASLKNPSLIYHFLNLLNQQNDKLDEKYTSTFKDPEEISINELVPYLTQIAPSLYVYRFHPSSKIKQAMNTIWTKLFPENIKAIRAHSKLIVQKAIPELTCPSYELRISYCLALEDLLRIEGNQFVSKYKDLMPTLLSNLYKLMDDVYESVRRTAYGTTKMYLQAFVQNIHRAKQAEIQYNELLNEIFPVLLSVGVPSKIQDIRKLSVQTLLDIIDHLGPLIKNHLPFLIPSMIENASEVEMCVRYTDQHQGNDILENVKEEIMSVHFSTEIVKRCMGYIDEDVLGKLLPRLLELLKETVSFSSRMAAINFVMLLTKNMNNQKLQPFVGKLLAALFTGLSNNHKNIRKNCANVIGSLCKSAKDSSIDNLLTKLMHLYIKNSQDENIKSAVGQTLLAVASQCQETVQAKSEKIVPVIFFAMHLKKTSDGANDQFIDLWNEVWNDVIGSMEVALSKYGVSIIIFLRESFNSASWNVKTQAARALSTFVNKSSNDIRDCQELKLLIQEVITTLSGKLWQGKEELLEPIASICSNKRLISENLYKEILEAVLRECGRGNIIYQTAAVEALGKILTSTEFEHDYFTDIYDKLKSIILKDEVENKTLEYGEPEENSSIINQKIKLKETAYSVLGKVWSTNEDVQKSYQEEIINMLSGCLFKSTRLTQVSIMVALKNILSKLHIIKRSAYSPDEKIIVDNLTHNVEKTIRYALELKKHTLLKKEALHIMINLVEQCSEMSNEYCLQRIITIYKDHINELSKDADPIIVMQTSQLKDLLKRNI